MSNGSPTSADITRLTSALNALNKNQGALVEGVRAMNTNLVAIHAELKESNARAT